MKSILSQVTMLKTLAYFLILGNIIQAQTIPGNNTYPSATASPFLPVNYVAGTKVNYVRTSLLLSPVTVETNILQTDYNQTRVSTQYMDGLGKLIQTVDHFQSPAKSDVVNLVKYDNFGRDAWHFLPYTKAEATASAGKFKLTAYSDQKDFYKNTMGYGTDNFFYTQTNYESSPLNRVAKTLSQGNSWVGNNRGITVTENPLAAGMNIRVFSINYATDALPVTSSVYATGDLVVKTTTDEDGYFTEEYSTKDNLVVLKATGKTGNAIKLLTYYIYDDFNQLRFVISPKATNWLTSNNWTLTTAIANELCYRYSYDPRSRVIIKDIPGAGSQYFVYDKKDQLIFTQTPTQRTKGEWLFNKYDVLGRLIQTGVYNSTATLSGLQTIVNASNAGTDPLLIYMFKDVYGNAAYTGSFTNAKILTTNYYDDYSFTTRTYDASVMSNLPVGWNTIKSNETTNLLTGSKVVVLDGAATPTELLTVNFYNDKGLLLQSQSQNHKGGWNITTNSYDFIGERIGTYTNINNPQATDNATVKTLETFFYDNAGRLTGGTHSLNGAAAKPVIVNNFDELGRVDNENFSNGAIPTIKYEYNVRNWLTAINKDFCYYINNTDVQSFGMEISYDYGYNKQYFNGNIAGIKWRNVGNPEPLRSYGYNYDAYNRLTSGDFVYKRLQLTAPYPWETTVQDFTASNITYDENGNLKTMKQMGLNTAGQKIILDDLSYAYLANSNKLLSVTESSSSQSTRLDSNDGLGDFRDYAGSNDYSYDGSGNVLTDVNKNLTFTYDEIVNKVKRVQKTAVTELSYQYDANGSRTQKNVYAGGTSTITDYIGSVVYINNSLSFINHPKGRIRYSSASSTPYMYDYFIKDHLGSTRSVITITDGAVAGFAQSSAPASTEVKYIATSETNNAAKENQLFDNIDNTRSPNPNKKSLDDNYVAKIYSNSSKTILGPDITIKVMAGDSVKISAEALYIAEKNNPQEVTKNAIDNFITAFTIPIGLVAEGVTSTSNNGLKNLANAILDLQNKQAKNGSPKAFLNYILYDQYMNLIAQGSGALQVKEKDGWQTLETEKMAIPQNGFLRVFSNNMEAAPMSINNTTLAVIPSKLVEEYNYYPFGLVFGGSSASPSVKKTDYLYNGKELQHNEFGQSDGLELTDYGARLYDAQIGRWTASDPMAESREWLSQYNYCQNNPILKIDPNGATDDNYYLNQQGQIVDYEATDGEDRYFEENSNGDYSRNINGTKMNFSENTNPDYAIVKTYIDPGIPGHTAIGMDGSTVGFYPAIHNASSIGGVPMAYRTYSSIEFETQYKLANIFFLKVTNADKENIKNSLIGMMGQVDAKSSPEYYLFNRNCTTQACNALNSMNSKFKMYHDFDGSVYDFGKLNYIIPASLNSFMKDQYENRDIGSPVKAWKNRSPYLRPAGSYVWHN